MKILITGNMGYVGPAVVQRLRATRPDATLAGLDIGYYGNCITATEGFPERLMRCPVSSRISGDSRRRSSNGVDAIVHLAAISNDPIGNRFEEVTLDINYRASIDLAKKAKSAGVRSFVFASSCSMYGSADDSARTESSPLNPLTAYARSKVFTETGSGAARVRAIHGHILAVFNRLRLERPAPAGSRPERFRRGRRRFGTDHDPERRDALAAVDRRQGHGPGDRLGDLARRIERTATSWR